MKTNKISRSLGMVKSSDFKARAKDALFGDVSASDVIGARYSSICFVDDDYQSVNPVADQAPTPASEPVAEPTAEPVSEPVVEPSAEPVVESAPKAAPAKPSNQQDKKISEAEARLLKETMKWKQKAKEAQSQLEATQAKKNPIEDAIGGLTVEEVKSLVEAKKDEERKAQEARGEYESILSQVQEQHATELSHQAKIAQEKDATIEALQGQINAINNQMEELTVGRHFSDSAFLKDRATLPPSIARQIFGAYFEVDGEEVVAYDKPRGNEGRAPLVNGQAENLGFEAAIERLITSHPESKTLLRSTMKPGSGSNTAGNVANVTEQLSGLDKIRKGLVG